MRRSPGREAVGYALVVSKGDAEGILVGVALGVGFQLVTKRPGREAGFPEGLVHRQVKGIHHLILALVDDEEGLARLGQEELCVGDVAVRRVGDQNFRLLR
jgi:hypothetical protein